MRPYVAAIDHVVGHECAHNGNQCGLKLLDGGYKAGYAGEVEEIGTPNVCDWVKVYTQTIREACGPTYDRVTWDPTDVSVKQRTIGHECGHSVNIQHHLQTGTTNCVMYDPCPTAEPVPHVYCTQAPQDCLHKFRLH